MKAKKNIVLLELIFICWLVVGMWNHSWASDFGPFEGKVVDAETKEPVEGVVVLIEWRQIHFFAGSTFIDVQETLTDKNGEFYISGIWIFNPWRYFTVDSELIIFRSGYQAIESGAWRDWNEFKTTLDYVSKVEDGKPIFQLKKLTTIEERRKNIPSEPSVPDEKHHLLKEKWKLLRQEINREHKSLGIGEID